MHAARGTFATGWIIAVIMLAALAVAVPMAFAAGVTDPDPGVRQFANPAIQNALADAAARQLAAATARRTAAARADRVASRSAYRGLRAAGALELAREKQADTMSARPWRSLQLDPGQRVKSYLGDFQALVDMGDGKNAIAESTLPMRAEDANGDLEPVDLTLEDTGNAFQPHNPLVSTQISHDPAQGVSFAHAGFGFAIAGANSQSSPELVDGKAFFANTATDTDLLIRPVPEGIETYFMVRSAAAPETARLHFNLPAGATLRDAWGADRSIEIATDLGVIGRIEPPAAWDADQVAVPVSATIDGDDVVLNFPHGGGDYHYPLTVDPIVGSSVQENFNLDGNGNRTACVNDNGDPFAGWNWSTNAYVNGDMFAHYSSVYCVNRGLTVYGYQGGYYYDNWYGEYSWISPRPSSFMERADFGYVTTTNRTGTCTVEGVWAMNRNDWDWGTWYDANGSSGGSPTLRSGAACSDLNGNYKEHCVGSSCVPGNPSTDATGTPRNSMVFGMVKFGSEYLQNWSTVRMEGATIWLYDQDSPSSPTVDQQTPVPGGWVHSVNLHTVLGSDDNQGAGGATGGGLGIKRFQLWRNAQLVAENPNGCVADRRNYCPVHWGTTFDYGTDLAGKPVIPEGVNTFQAVAYDVLGKPGYSGQWTVRVDRQGPSISASGTLWNARNTTVSPGAYDMSISTSDALSGVGGGTLYVDGVAQSCVSSCSLHFDTNESGTGTHTFRIEATDHVTPTPNLSSVSFNVTFALPADYDQCLDDSGTPRYCALYNRDDPASTDYPAGGTDYEGSEALARPVGTPIPDEGEPAPTGTVTYDACYARFGALAPECSIDKLQKESLGSGGTSQRVQVKPPIYGMANDPQPYGQPLILDDPNFQALNVKKIRVILPYNIMQFDGKHDLNGDGIADGYDRNGDGINDAADQLFERWNALYSRGVKLGYEFMVSFSYRDDFTTYDDDGNVGYQVGKTIVRGDQDFIPNGAKYRDWVLLFRQNFGAVQRFTAWNEPNHPEQPLRSGRRGDGLPYGAGPKKAAYFTYLLQRDVCAEPDCKVIAGDFWAGTKVPSDPSKKSWVSYASAYRDALAGYDTGASGKPNVPQNWGLHPYWDVRYIDGEPQHGSTAAVPPVALSATGTAAFWNLVPSGADVWFTEVGSRMDRCCTKTGLLSYYRNTEATQATEVDGLLNKLALYNGGAERLYYYQWREWDGTKADSIWDSGLMKPDGTPRSSYTTFASRP